MGKVTSGHGQQSKGIEDVSRAIEQDSGSSGCRRIRGRQDQSNDDPVYQGLRPVQLREAILSNGAPAHGLPLL